MQRQIRLSHRALEFEMFGRNVSHTYPLLDKPMRIVMIGSIPIHRILGDSSISRFEWTHPERSNAPIFHIAHFALLPMPNRSVFGAGYHAYD